MKAIKEFIAEHLIGTEIFEMARSLDDYNDLIISKIEPIISHIILVMKAKEEKSDEFVEHWKKEISILLGKFIGIRLKVKNTYEFRRKHVESILYDKYELDTDEKEILGIIRRKLFLEGYDLEDNDVSKSFIHIIRNFQSKYLDKLIDVIASDSTTKIREFIEEL